MIIQSQTSIYVDQRKVLSGVIDDLLGKLKLNDHNKQVYAELVKDLRERQNGLFSFTFRVNAGEIVDYVVMDNIPPEVLIDG